ncbi:MAG: type II secretion system minor pseudopilin GspI [Chromatocurvus sp.]
MINRPPQQSGFTLVEVMVALAIVALSVPALLFTLDQHIDGTAHLRDKSMASLVAGNKLAEVRLLAASRRQLLQGSETGSADMAGREWFWWLESEQTQVPQFYRIEVRVGLREGQRNAALISRVAYLSADFSDNMAVPGA